MSPVEKALSVPPPSSQVPSGRQRDGRPHERARPLAAPGPGDERGDDDVQRRQEAGVGDGRRDQAGLLQPAGNEEGDAAPDGDRQEGEAARCLAARAPRASPAAARARAATAPRAARKVSGPTWLMADFWNTNARPQMTAANSRAISACSRDMRAFRLFAGRAQPRPWRGAVRLVLVCQSSPVTLAYCFRPTRSS